MIVSEDRFLLFLLCLLLLISIIIRAIFIGKLEGNFSLPIRIMVLWTIFIGIFFGNIKIDYYTSNLFCILYTSTLLTEKDIRKYVPFVFIICLLINYLVFLIGHFELVTLALAFFYLTIFLFLLSKDKNMLIINIEKNQYETNPSILFILVLYSWLFLYLFISIEAFIA